MGSSHSPPLPLAIDHLRHHIRRRATSGAIATAGVQGGLFALTLAYNAVLARLLSPHDFGLVAMAVVVGGFLQVFKDAGLSTATIQREDITEAQVSNLFWLNTAVGGVATVVMAASAPVLAWFFQQSELMGIAVALSLSPLLEALAVQHTAILNRQMRFGLLSSIDFGCTAAGFVTGAVLAIFGWGYWSLVGTTLSTVVLKLTVVWSLSRWRPQRPTRHSGTRPLVRFGATLTLVGLVYSFSRNCDSLFIGRVLGSDAVGLYSRSTVLVTRPLDRLIWPIYSVIIPSLSRLQAEPERYRRAFLQVFDVLAMVGYFLAGLLYPLAGALVRVILGPQWDAAAPIFGALTLLCLSRPLAIATGWLYTSQGRGRDLLVTTLLDGICVVSAFAIGLQFGVTGVAIAYSVSSLVAVMPLMFYIAGRSGPVTTRHLWFAAVSHTPVFAAVWVATWLAARSWIVSTAVRPQDLVLCLTMGTAAGLAMLWVLPRNRRAIREFATELSALRRRPSDESVDVGC